MDRRSLWVWITRNLSSARGQYFLENLGRHKDQEFGAIIAYRRGFEEKPEIGQIPEKRHLFLILASRLLEDAAQHYCIAVVDQHLCINRPCIHTWYAREFLAHLILVDSQIHDDAVVWCDLWSDAETEDGFLE